MDNNENYKQELDMLKSQFNISLKNYKKNYILYHMYPTNNEYYDIFFNNENQLNDILKNIDNLTSKIQQSINDLLYKFNIINDSLGLEINKEDLMIKNNIDLNNKKLNSKKLINNSKDIYKYKTLRNIEIFLGIITIFIFLSYHIKNKYFNKK